MEGEIQQHKTEVQIVQTPPDKVDVGTEMSLQVKVSCPEKCSLVGGRLGIVDEEGAVVEELELAPHDEEAEETLTVSVKAPAEPGAYTWTVGFTPPESEEVQHEPSSASFTFTAKPHRLGISVWGIPLPATNGEEFTVMVGAKCSANCPLGGLSFIVRNAEGEKMASGLIGDDPLPQTTGLYWTEQTLVAPAEEGLHKWVVECESLTPGLELPHEVSGNSFAFKASRPPEHTITVEVIDKDRNKPLKNASAFIHPYRSYTDENGIARVEVTKGTHELYVKMQDYSSFQTIVEVTEDMTVRAELFSVPDPYA